jgi:hypothetical protein
MLGDFRRWHGFTKILLVGKYKYASLLELLIQEKFSQLSTNYRGALSICAINNKDDAIRV